MLQRSDDAVTIISGNEKSIPVYKGEPVFGRFREFRREGKMEITMRPKYGLPVKITARNS
jgi:hypothetical protein